MKTEKQYKNYLIELGTNMILEIDHQITDIIRFRKSIQDTLTKMIQEPEK